MSTTMQLPPPSDPRTAAEWIEFYYAQGWSDGLPLVPPTEESVQEMLAAGTDLFQVRYELLDPQVF